MKHKFSGRWRSLRFPDGTTSTVDDGEIYLRLHQSNGTVQTGSNHEGIALTGNATVVSAGHELELKQVESGNIREYEGLLASEEDTNGIRSTVIIGRYKDIAVPLLPAKATKGKKSSKKAAAPPQAQNEGVWVITKP